MLYIKILPTERRKKMHLWGDEWFEQYGDDLNNAIKSVEQRMHKWAHVEVCGKEKYGTYRDEYFRMWDGSMTQIFLGYRATYKWNIIYKIMWHIDHYLIPVKKTKFGWLKKGLADFNHWIGLTKLVWKWQAKMVNKAFQVTCKEYPNVIDELIVDVDCYEMIKPCKWGDVDGKKIHDKYWKPVNYTQ